MNCCCTGHRPKGFPWNIHDKRLYLQYRTQLRNLIVELIEKYSIKQFISGMALGADTDFAEIVLDLKNDYDIKLLCAVPCANQYIKWKNVDIDRYKAVLQQADNVVTLSQEYTSTCMQERNKFMVDNSDIVLAIWNGLKTGGTWQTIKYATTKQKQIHFLRLDQLNCNKILD